MNLAFAAFDIPLELAQTPTHTNKNNKNFKQLQSISRSYTPKRLHII